MRFPPAFLGFAIFGLCALALFIVLMARLTWYYYAFMILLTLLARVQRRLEVSRREPPS